MYNRLGQFPGSVAGTLRAPAGMVPYPEHSKSQWIRLADVMIIGPGMIYSAMRQKPPAWLKAGLIIAGIGTVLYNVNNFWNIHRQAALIEKQRIMRSQVAEPTAEDLLL